MSCSALAAPSETTLGSELAQSLLAKVLDIQPSVIRVASIVEGSQRTEDGFEQGRACRVTAVLPILEDGRMQRQARCYGFTWNEEYGWFYQEIHQARGGAEVWIWSERKGEIVIR